MIPTLKAIFNTVLPIICWLYCAITSSKLAYKKNRDTQTWFFLGLFFGLLALLVIYFLKPLKTIKKNQKISISVSKNHFSVLKTDNNYWYYLDKTQNQIGPMSLNKIYDYYLKKTISKDTYVWNDTMTCWKKLIDIPLISNILKKSTN